MKKLLRKKGFTLVEVIVASAITVILLGSVMALFSSTRNVLSSMKTNPFVDQIENSVCDYVRQSLEKSNGYRIGGVSQADLTSTAVTYLSELTCGAGEKNKCLIVSGTEGSYKLYDLGEVTSTNITSKIASLADYNAYSADFYSGKSCKFAVSQSIDSNSRITYLNVTTQLFNDDGSITAQPTGTYFKMLNAPDAANAQIKTAGLDDLATAYPDADTCIIFIYRIKNYTP